MLIDIIIVIVLIISLIRGYNIGFVRQFFSTVGFVGGLLLGAYLERFTIEFAHTSFERSFIALLTTLGLAFIGVTILEHYAIKIKRKLLIIKINFIDGILGSLMSIITVLLAIWLGVALLNSFSIPQLQIDLNNSKIISYLNHHLPPAPAIIADLGHIIDPNGIPQVFLQGEPTLTKNIPIPNLKNFKPAILADEPSVVKIVGQGCGGIVEGSGFVVQKNLIMTNAHVVAGILHPYITTLSGQTLEATTVYFNPNFDLALLRVNNLRLKALTLSSNIFSDGTLGAVLGYPGGGNMTVVGASILNQLMATGQNIYGNNTTTRSIYEIHAKVIPGNSGGPLINQTGQVMGIVFAQSTTYYHIGYALTSNKVISYFHQNKNNQKPVSTGGCAD